MARGRYKEVRDITFSPQRERIEELLGKPENGLTRLKLTPEDFRDFRDIQPLVLTEENLWNYDTKSRGDETMDGVDCWVLQARPRQILEGQRFFDGLIWADKKGYNIVRIAGRAVPQIRSTKTGEPVSPLLRPGAGPWTASIGFRRSHWPTIRSNFAAGRSASGCASFTVTTNGSRWIRRSRRNDEEYT